MTRVDDIVGDRSKIDALVPQLLTMTNTPGACVSIADSDGNVISCAAGIANLDTQVEATEDTLFQTGSIAKVYTATLVMQLIDEGLAGLDQPVGELLPETAGAPLAAITVRQLLTHTSGLDAGDHFADFGRGADAIEQYVYSLLGDDLLHDPGAYWSYCNGGYVVLGLIIQRLRAQPWHDALRKRLLQPAGLQETAALPEHAIVGRIAVGHVDTLNGPRVAERWSLPDSVAPAGAQLGATAGDLARFGAFHAARDPRLGVSPRLLRTMQQPHAPKFDGTHAGLGWNTWSLGDISYLGHTGGGVGQSSTLVVIPERGVAIATVANSPRVGVISGAVLYTLLPAPMPSTTSATTDAQASTREQLERFVGVYARKDIEYRIELRDGQLHADITWEPYLLDYLPPPEPLALTPLTAETFSAIDPQGRTVGTWHFLEPDEEGKPHLVFTNRIAKRR